MELPEHTEKDNVSIFLEIARIPEYCREVCGLEIDIKHARRLIDLSILPAYASGSLIIKDDLVELLPVLSMMTTPDAVDVLSGNLFSEGLALSHNCRIEMPAGGEKINPAFYAAIRNLITRVQLSEGEKLIQGSTLSYFPHARVSTFSSDISQYVTKQKQRVALASFSEPNDFAGSAHYMGSKRQLAGFLVEAISRFVPTDGVVVDLMCGSGAASRAFSRTWRTIASDLQEFCKLLAIVQGGGFTKERAEVVLSTLLPIARKHANDLRGMLSEFISIEDKLLHSDLGPTLLAEYRRFLMLVPTYPDATDAFNWQPTDEVIRRKKHPKLYPYCLFSSYFANVFFGVRQCVEIDSLRFAIDQLEHLEDRRWALGALITTISALSTTHAAHFAQPRIKDSDSLRLDDLPHFIEQRAYSILHEFSVRLMNLSEESEIAANPVEIVPGPWEDALTQLEPLFKNKSLVVYVDAPYKREEYSRYYHVLETLVTYSYPASLGKGRLPDKGTKERPSSEFFTRSQLNINLSFIQLISSILQRGWTCAWSYATSGSADMVTVLNQVYAAIPCQIQSYATPYEHKAQGKGKVKKVSEYLIAIVPK